MEAYLQGQDLWNFISGEDVLPEDTPQNGEARRKWKIKCGKALFALRTSISKDYIEHVLNVQSPKEVWETLDRLFTQKNMMRLQFLENELAGTIQNKLTISEYFLKVKSLCSEISELDAEGVVKEARLHRYLIRGLCDEFMPFISSIQGQSSSRAEEVLYAKDKGKSKFTAKSPSAVDKVPKPVSDADTRANVSIDYNYEWIIDSGYSHHATGNDSLLSCVRPHNQKKVIVTADNSLHPVVNERQFCIEKDVSLDDVYHVSGLKKNLASVSQIADSGRFTANEAYIEKTSQYANATLRHARLGHVGFQLLHKISEKKLLEGVPQFKKIYPDVVCFGCQYGKSHRLPFSNSKNKASAVLQLIHSDLMGPQKHQVIVAIRVMCSGNSVRELCCESVTFVARTKLERRQNDVFLLAMSLTGKDGVWIQKQRKSLSLVMLCDEISSDHIGANDKSITADLLPVCGDAESNDKRSITTSSGENVQQSETIEAGARRSDRQRRPPTHLADYEVEVNLSSMIYAFLMGESCDDEPKSYDDAIDDPKWKTSSSCIMVLLYVDDMIITSYDDTEITRLQEALSVHFDMKSLGGVSCFLGLEVTKSDGFFVSQQGYASNLLDRFRMRDSKPMTTPMESYLKLAKDEGKLLEDATLFCQLVGSLFYLSITRPGISFSIRVISQFMGEP
ncbi:hypothetical protein SASPL_148610 [Salvia splendens]|uniref:Uncharacterized protein n=1 Tax=Salvia splendens TaxID=180675 RepID=A0A8X8WA17_SALSN|nr:hypothetical protein SASPL_148610 [Salvia splendens]